ncbi:MAG: TIGR04283 family arsenosugar biosynthesis glycosyltransferase [Desulfotignum sp.]|nr:TIGR04283 family arsenosugar biosynthesis glycosyltransferase [Desulfotignum sp.]MCF8089068.1 TIGR04283 family arsenosugar biosynthesis glycosyltransferase [Desulfotignum sp.]MCF8138338.1 TIGR04283 family arsenosugar biosynthesis glycosyltransferase [Desulfotignum sp.]
MTISVIVPVFQEANTIHAFLKIVQAVFPARVHEIIVVDGSPAGDTLAAVALPQVKTIHSRKGRARQMNHGAAMAKGDILLFLHADTLLPGDAPQLITDLLSGNPDLMGGAFSLGIDDDRIPLKIIEWFANLRSRLTRVPYGDQSIFIRKDCFDRAGGFMEIPIMEDLELMTRIRKQGRRIQILKQKSVTSSRRWNKEGIAACTLRNWLIRLLYHFGVPADRLASWYK